MSRSTRHMLIKACLFLFQSTSKPHRRDYFTRTAKRANRSERFVVRCWPWWIGPAHSCDSSCIQKRPIDVRLFVWWFWCPVSSDKQEWFLHSIITGAECDGGYLFVFYRCNDWVWLKRHAVHVVECRHTLSMWWWRTWVHAASYWLNWDIKF